MPAKTSLRSAFSRIIRTKKPLYLVAILAVAGLAAWASSTRRATASPQTESTITPALKLAAGTLKLEGTEQAIDAASAAKLLPLWQLLAQLDSSDASAPQEISAVIDEIQLNMTASQIEAVSAMSFTGQDFSSSSASTAKASGTQAAASGAMTGSVGMFAGGGPMDGGGPMPGGGARSGSTSGSSVSTSASPSLIDQVIQLLEKKVQG